jgi:hypothetical protein
MIFTGYFFLRRRVLARYPAAMAELRHLISHVDFSVRVTAQRALLWSERERLSEGPFSSGPREGLSVESIKLK